jgi:hypothetical protein
METWGAALLAVCTIIGVALKGYQAKQAERKEHTDDTNIQNMRQAIENGQGDQIDAALADQHDRIDRLLGPDPGPGTGSSPGGQTDNRDRSNDRPAL